MTKKRILAVMVSAAFATGMAQAQVNINTNYQFATQTTNSSLQDISTHAASVEERLALLGELVKGYANGTYTAAQVTNYINNSAILKNGDTFQLFKRPANTVGAGVSAEPLIAVGSGSTFGTKAGGGADIENVASVTLNGTTYNFAGSTTSGGVAIGTPTETRSLTNLSAGRLSDNSLDAVNGSQLHATNKALGNLATQVNTNTTNIGKGLNFKGKDNQTTNVQLGDTLTITGDANINTTVANKTVTVGLNKDLTGLDSATFTGGVVINNNGINAGNHKITNVAPGTVSATSTDAVNGAQLFANKAKGFTVVDAASGQLQVLDAGQLNVAAEDNNIIFHVKNGKLQVGLAKDLTGLNSATFTTGVVIGNGVNFGGHKATNMADGTISATSKDGVNGSQIHALKNDLENRIANVGGGNGFTVEDTAGNTQRVPDNGKLNIAAKDTNVTFGVENGKVQVGLNKDLTGLNSATFNSGVSIGNGVNFGGHKSTNMADGTISATSKDGVNGSQLYALQQQVTANKAKGFTVVDEAGNTQQVADNGKLNIAAKDSNVTFGVENGKVQVGLNKDLTGLNSTTYTGGVTINNNGINGGNHKIDGVADGDINANSKQAINGSQLFNYVRRVAGGGFTAVAQDGSRLDVTAGGDFNVVGGRNIETKVENGKFVVQTVKDAEFNTVKVGDININDGGKITNINDGRIAEGSRDAINGGQIHALKQEINQNNKTLRQGIASAFAAQIEYPEQRPGEVAAGIGIGHYDGETAAAVGVSLLTENGKYKVNATYSQGLSRHAKPGGKVSFGMLF